MAAWAPSLGLASTSTPRSLRSSAAGAMEACASTTTSAPEAAARTASATAATYAARPPRRKWDHAPATSKGCSSTRVRAAAADVRMSAAVGASVLSRAATSRTRGPTATARSAMARSIRVAAKPAPVGVRSAAAPMVEQVQTTRCTAGGGIGHRRMDARDECGVVRSDALGLHQQVFGDDVLHVECRIDGLGQVLKGFDVDRRRVKKGDVAAHG